MDEQYNLLESGDLTGYARHQAERSQQHLARVASAAALWGDLLNGRVPSYYLHEAIAPRTPAMIYSLNSNYPGLFRMQEAMTRSDFPLLTGDVLDRMALGRYREFPSPWRAFCKVSNNLRDFRTVRRIAANGLEGTWSTQAEHAELEYDDMDETGYTYAPKKYAKGAKISFEALMNDDLDQFSSIPDRLGRGGARTVAKFATGLYVDASGPHTDLYTAGNGNIVTSNPVLSVSALNTAFTKLGAMVDADGEPIYVEEAILVVPPALRVTANNIINQLTVETTEVGGSTNQRVVVNNWIVANLRLVVDPYIPIVASTANGSTSWFLFADPNLGRPALEVGFITGFGEPALYQKQSNTMRVGGSLEQMAGDFSTMSQEYKGVIAFGGTRLDPKSTVGSNGSGS